VPTVREWYVQLRKGAAEVWHGIGRWTALFSLIGCIVAVLVSIILIRDYPPGWAYVAVTLVSLFIAWILFFRKHELPKELESGDR